MTASFYFHLIVLLAVTFLFDTVKQLHLKQIWKDILQTGIHIF